MSEDVCESFDMVTLANRNPRFARIALETVMDTLDPNSDEWKELAQKYLALCGGAQPRGPGHAQRMKMKPFIREREDAIDRIRVIGSRIRNAAEHETIEMILDLIEKNPPRPLLAPEHP